MYAIKDDLRRELDEIEDAGLTKTERLITTPQSAHIATEAGEARNFCANNYLGLANHPDVVAAARDALDDWGFGMASVRFICGTQTQHRELEEAIADLVGTEDSVLFPSCFDANGGIFEVLLGPEDVIISDALNHASIIDGVRLSKAQRRRYANRDMADLRQQLEEAKGAGARRILVVTDGAFSMDGYLAPLAEICDLAEELGALVMVDDSHATGFVGEHGRGSHEACGVMDRVDIVTGTLTDLVAAAEHLHDTGWVARDRLAIEGGSAGGLLVGAAANLAPGRFRAVLAEVPFVDALTTILRPDLPLTVGEWDEWGNPLEDPAVYAYMRSYSPYEGVQPVEYPAILATTSLNDTRVSYTEPAKWVARLRETVTNELAERPVLLRTEMVAGHGGRSGRYSAWEQTAWEWSWVLDQIGATEPLVGDSVSERSGDPRG